MPTKPLLMIGAAETLHKTSITKNGMLTWTIVIQQLKKPHQSQQQLQLQSQQHLPRLFQPPPPLQLKARR